jgi:hypothetical protein
MGRKYYMMRRSNKLLKHCWILFDLSNGDPIKGFYCWYFSTRKQAREKYKEHLNNKNFAQLTKPYKYILGESK